MFLPGDTMFYWVRDLSPTLIVRLKKPLLFYIDPDYDGRAVAWTSCFPSRVAASNWQGAADALIVTMRDRLVRLHANRGRIAPDLYDEYRALAEYLEL